MTIKINELFEKMDFLKQVNVAYRCNMNAGRLRQYTSGVREPSHEQLKQIESALHKLGDELSKVKLK
jgi:transcriptional regulator with XRE-family HTH domain